MAQCRDVEICSDLLHLDTAIDSASRPIIHFVVRRSVCRLLLLDALLGLGREQPLNARE